jgi:uncharacterized protein
MFSLFPKDENFFELFRRQAVLVHQGGQLLEQMVLEFDRLEERARALKDVEHQGDLVAHELFERLNRTFITPLDREDIHGLASGLDDVLDAIEGISSRIVLFKIPAATPQAKQLTRIVAECGVQIEQAVGHLKDFKGLMPFTIEINRLENEADALSRQAVADLFSGTHDFLDVIRWKEIYGRLENATDQCEDVANVIEAIVLKSR